MPAPYAHPLFRPRVFAAALAGLVAGAGCTGPAHSGKMTKPPAPVVRNFNGDPRLPKNLRRVVLLPIAGGEAAPTEAAGALDAVFATALVRQARFEVVPLSREECQRRFGTDSLVSTAALPDGMLAELGRDYAAQGVLFVDLTAYHAMRPIALGIRAKLALVAETRLVWSCDEIFSGGNPAIVAGLRRYYASAGGDRSENPINLPESALLSPSRFGAYVADMTFQTLPAR